MTRVFSHNKVQLFILLSALVFCTIMASGCLSSRTDGIKVIYSVEIFVVDDNGSVIKYAPDIYDIDGVLSNTSYHMSRGFGAGKAFNGTSRGDGNVWPVYPEDYMVFGASLNNSSLQSDWDNRRFNNGSAGNWVVVTYEDIASHMIDNKTAMLNVTIYVSNKTGMMIKR